MTRRLRLWAGAGRAGGTLAAEQDAVQPDGGVSEGGEHEDHEQVDAGERFGVKQILEERQVQPSAGFRALPYGLEALTGAALIKEMEDQFAQILSSFGTFLLIFAVVALLVGAFMIFNTFAITVAQKTRENALMRALRASKRQVLGSVLLEAVVVGIIASLIGLAAGVAAAMGLKAMLNGLGFTLPASGVVFTARTALVAGLAGLAVTAARRCPVTGSERRWDFRLYRASVPRATHLAAGLRSGGKECWAGD